VIPDHHGGLLEAQALDGVEAKVRQGVGRVRPLGGDATEDEILNAVDA